jgi:hypothetical protein
VALTDSGKALADQIRELWVTLAEETVRDLPAATLRQLPGILHTMSTNVDGKSPAWTTGTPVTRSSSGRSTGSAAA